jgi:hypothetical protein
LPENGEQRIETVSFRLEQDSLIVLRNGETPAFAMLMAVEALVREFIDGPGKMRGFLGFASE